MYSEWSLTEARECASENGNVMTKRGWSDALRRQREEPRVEAWGGVGHLGDGKVSKCLLPQSFQEEHSPAAP